jgi:hypothetical protein
LALAATAVGETFEYSEIRDETEVSSGSFFYCEGREIRPYFEQDPLQQGQEVEFYAVPALSLALYTHVVPKLQEVNGVSRNMEIGALKINSYTLCSPVSALISIPQIVFNKGRINVSLKQAQVKSGFKGVTMAKGPEGPAALDGSGGFAPGWREHPSVDEFPWAHLLSHMT